MTTNRDNRFIVVYVLTAVFFGLIFYQWLKIAPYKEIQSKPDSTWSDVGQRVGQAMSAIASNFGAAGDKVADLQTETIKQTKQKVLINGAKEYLANFSSASTTTSTLSNY